MSDTLKDTVVALDSMGRMLDFVSTSIAPDVSEQVDRDMMFRIGVFLDDIIALALQTPIPNSRRRRTFQKAAAAFASEKESRIRELIALHGQRLVQLGAKDVDAPLQKLAELAILETLLMRAETSH